MEIKEYFTYRKDLLNDSSDEEDFISENNFLSQVMPLLLETKLIDSEDYNESYFLYNEDKLKINGYTVNESQERLQLFIVNEESINLNAKESTLQISQKSYYETQFARAVRFANKAIKNHLTDILQDSGPVQTLTTQLSSAQGNEQFDVIEVFLISLTTTVETRGEQPQPKKIIFDDEKIKVSFVKDGKKHVKEILVIKKLVDLNFLFNVLISQGNREVLTIDFEKEFNMPLEAIKAADEEHFESYLCAMPASVISDLYKKHSSRLLEKNVRSFLQFKGVNKGIRETIREYPEKFIAYNNGLTITSTAKVVEHIKDKYYIKSLTDFQIVNGGQTTASIYFTHKDGFDISKVKVMAKINVAKNVTEEQMEDLISKISKYSNSQSKVSNVDLRSRNPQLNKLKSLSDSVLSPTGLKWFFEKSKGDYNTLLRKAGKNRTRFEKEYPKSRRFTKEELGKYYSAWGEQPYMVKKGGEKVFRYFIEKISAEGKNKKETEINRFFYEELIAKIIIFRSLEKIYGMGSGAIGQIRSAVVPYSISILYKYTTKKNSSSFDLSKIWKSEMLEEDLTVFFKSLMILMNDLIKKYSGSDDYGEYSKKEELWKNISDCKEIRTFIQQANSVKIISKYSISRDALKKRESKKSLDNIDFEPLYDMVSIYSNSGKFYKKVLKDFSDNLKENEKYKLELIINAIKNQLDIGASYISFEKGLIKNIRNNTPDLFDSAVIKEDQILKQTLDFILKKYNTAIESERNIKSEFVAIGELAGKKGAKYHSVFSEIGKGLDQGKAPSVKQLFDAGNYVAMIKN